MSFFLSHSYFGGKNIHTLPAHSTKFENEINLFMSLYLPLLFCIQFMVAKGLVNEGNKQIKSFKIRNNCK